MAKKKTSAAAADDVDVDAGPRRKGADQRQLQLSAASANNEEAQQPDDESDGSQTLPTLETVQSRRSNCDDDDDDDDDENTLSSYGGSSSTTGGGQSHDGSETLTTACGDGGTCSDEEDDGSDDDDRRHRMSAKKKTKPSASSSSAARRLTGGGGRRSKNTNTSAVAASTTADDTESNRESNKRDDGAKSNQKKRKKKRWGIQKLLRTARRGLQYDPGEYGDDDDVDDDGMYSASASSASSDDSASASASASASDAESASTTLRSHVTLTTAHRQDDADDDDDDDDGIGTETVVSGTVVSNANDADGNDGATNDDDDDVVVHHVATFPDASSILRLGSRLFGYDTEEEEEAEEGQKKKNGKDKEVEESKVDNKDEDDNENTLLEAIGEDEEGVDNSRRRSPAAAASGSGGAVVPPMSITFSQDNGNSDDNNYDASNAAADEKVPPGGPLPLASARTTSNGMKPVGSPEKITIRRDPSNLLLISEAPTTPKRINLRTARKKTPFHRNNKSASTTSSPENSPPHPLQRKPRRTDRVIVSVLSCDDGTATPRSSLGMCGAGSAAAPHDVDSATRTSGAWYGCGVGACNGTDADDSGSVLVLATAEDDEVVADDRAWTANFDDASFGGTDVEGQEQQQQQQQQTDDNADLLDAPPKLHVQCTKEEEKSVPFPQNPSSASLDQQAFPPAASAAATTPSRHVAAGQPPSPTSVIPDKKGGVPARQEGGKGQTSEDLKKQVDELNQHLSQMSYDMKLLSSIVAEQEQNKLGSAGTPTSTASAGDLETRRSLADDIDDDEVEDKYEVMQDLNLDVDEQTLFSVEVPLQSYLAKPSKEQEEEPEKALIEKPSIDTAVTSRVTVASDDEDKLTATPATLSGKGKPKPPRHASSRFSLFKGRKKGPVQKSSSQRPPNKKSSSIFFRRSSKSKAPKGTVDGKADVSPAPPKAEASPPPAAAAADANGQTFGDALISAANDLLDQAAGYAFPPDESVSEEVAVDKKASKAKKDKKKDAKKKSNAKKKEMAKAKKGTSKPSKNKSKARSSSRQPPSRSASKKKTTRKAAAAPSHDDDDDDDSVTRSDRICRVFEDCGTLYHDICSLRELTCMCQDIGTGAQDEANLALCRIDNAVKDSIRGFGERCIAVADDTDGDDQDQRVAKKRSSRSRSKSRTRSSRRD